MQSEPTYEDIRAAYGRETADDGWWHQEDYERDVERQRQKFDAWVRNHDAELIERLADRFPLATGGTISPGGVRSWLLDQAQQTRGETS